MARKTKKHSTKKRTVKRTVKRRRTRLGDTPAGHTTKARDTEKAVVEYSSRAERALAQGSCFSASMNVYDAVVAKGAYSAQAVEAGLDPTKHDRRVFEAWEKFRSRCGR